MESGTWKVFLGESEEGRGKCKVLRVKCEVWRVEREEEKKYRVERPGRPQSEGCEGDWP